MGCTTAAGVLNILYSYAKSFVSEYDVNGTDYLFRYQNNSCGIKT